MTYERMILMLGYFQRVKVCCTLAGAAAVLVGQKIAESETIRKTAVDIMSAGIKAVNDVSDYVKSIYDEAADKATSDCGKSCCDSGETAGDGVSVDDSESTYKDDHTTD